MVERLNRVVILGCGYAGTAIAQLAREREMSVLAHVRSDARADSLRVAGFEVLQLASLGAEIAAHVDGRSLPPPPPGGPPGPPPPRPALPPDLFSLPPPSPGLSPPPAPDRSAPRPSTLPSAWGARVGVPCVARGSDCCVMAAGPVFRAIRRFFNGPRLAEAKTCRQSELASSVLPLCSAP